MRNIKLNKQQLITTLFILLCLFGYIYFPAKGNFQYKSVFFIFLVILPLLYNKYFLKGENILNQVVLGDWKKNIKYLLIGLLGSFVIMIGIFKFTDLGIHYLLPKNVKMDFWNFLIYEFTGIVYIVGVYEVFFRGFVMKYFQKYFNEWSILIQFLFFIALILMLRGLPYWYYIVYLIFTPFAGWIYYKTKSILYSFVGQWLFIFCVDIAFIMMFVHK